MGPVWTLSRESGRVTIAVLIVDDSAVVRQVLQQVLAIEKTIEVVGVASDPIFAMRQMGIRWPDVIILDVEMPRMDGITFLKKIMHERPTPVVICSTLTEQGASTTMDALSAGAVSIVTKPKVGLKQFLEDASSDLIQAVKTAARANLGNLVPAAEHLRPQAVRNNTKSMAQTTEHIVAIGTSTGGTQALEAVLTALPDATPGIVIVQHMPAQFTAMFAQRLNELAKIEVREARNGDRILPNQALIAPGGQHMSVVRSGAQYQVQIKDGPLVNRHKPSVDVLFKSVARCAGRNATGFILTGMGDDGARGLKLMRDAGAVTYAQDEASSVVFGMPKEAIAIDAATHVVSLKDVPRRILQIRSC
ncbi:chemotaxis response regulator protein-glutamate methylesterase [Aliidiomarina sedimenti]|uniref:Protein-glutamate methylesterase/protein-glutamine glutaminase n=1 Tax=Aliidiomarina sedimenti TaxID=1933879 RepID=A0ABY0C2T9_9GAMM|nr:chemotaxis response regulator protein-glutamate methylesterase [Aliidiomarina sedimenti]RUO31907.1 chemotaxis response regulator protein-glutamate methylesterase [Aliidiomarina sedimenti]